MKLRALVMRGLAVLLGLAACGVGAKLLLHARADAAVEAEIAAERPARLPAFGETARLRVLPLLDYHVARPGLRGDAGVSYLVETEATRVLFDTGNNTAGTLPSPLQQNMAALGVGPGDFDAVFI